MTASNQASRNLLKSNWSFCEWPTGNTDTDVHRVEGVTVCFSGHLFTIIEEAAKDVVTKTPIRLRASSALPFQGG